MKDKKELTEEQIRVAHLVADTFTGIANMIMNSQNPQAAFAIVMDGIGSGSEHIAYCSNCEPDAAVCEAIGISGDEYRAVAQELNRRFCEMTGVDPTPSVPEMRNLH